MSIAGTYKHSANENMLAFFKTLGANEDQLKAAGATAEEKDIVMAVDGGKYTMDLGHSKSTFEIGKEFEGDFMGGAVKAQ